MTKKRIHVVDSRVLVMGLAFKENCPDLRNTRVVDLVEGFNNLNCHVYVFDPWVDKQEAIDEYGIQLIDEPVIGKYDAIILAVAHDQFKELGAVILRSYGKEQHILYDIKYILDLQDSDGRL